LISSTKVTVLRMFMIGSLCSGVAFSFKSGDY